MGFNSGVGHRGLSCGDLEVGMRGDGDLEEVGNDRCIGGGMVGDRMGFGRGKRGYEDVMRT